MARSHKKESREDGVPLRSEWLVADREAPVAAGPRTRTV